MGRSPARGGMRGPLGGVVDRLRGEERRWAGTVEDLLYEGETVRRRVAVGGNEVVVTSHRLLAFTPTSDAENYRAVDLPNVADVTAGYDGEEGLLFQAGRAFLYGAVLLAVGVFVDFEAFVPTDAFAGTGDAVGRLGLGGMFSLMNRMLELLASLDDVARAIGALVVLFSVFVLAVYLLTRDRAVVVGVAGDADDVVVPVGNTGTEVDIKQTIADLEGALFDPADGAGTGSDVGPGSDARPGGDAGFGSDRDGSDLNPSDSVQ